MEIAFETKSVRFVMNTDTKTYYTERARGDEEAIEIENNRQMANLEALLMRKGYHMSYCVAKFKNLKNNA